MHAKSRWSSAIDLALWPYAVRNTVYVHNSVPWREDGRSCLELFSSVRVGVKMKHLHASACPVFALQNELASGNTLPKWSPRARLGLNLGQSPNHARNVYLVLNLITGLVSRQFHVKFDDLFETTRYAQLDSGAFSTWKKLARL